MELPNLSAATDFLGGLKDRLPSRKRNNEDAFYDDYYDEEAYYDENDDFDDFGYDEVEADKKPSTSSPGYYDPGYPQLVNLEEIRASVRQPRADTPSSRFAPSRETVSAYDDTHMDNVTGAIDYTTPYDRSFIDGASRPMTPAEKVAAKAEATGQFSAVGSSSRYAGTSASSSAAFDPFNAYQESRSFSRTPIRKLTTIKPMSYDDVEGIARAVRAGDAVVLVLRLANVDLTRRILDFSFGVASALNARVDCIADKVFVITTGAELNPSEKRRLNQDGIL